MTTTDQPSVAPRQGAGSPAVRRTVATLACATLLAVPVVATSAGPAAAAPVAASSRPAPALDRAARTTVAAGAVGFTAYVRDGRHVYRAKAGLADRATHRPIGADDQFEIGSNTKTFTSVLALQLVARGQLALDDTIEKHLPGVVPGGDGITLRQLLSHTSGIFDYTHDEPFMKSVESGSSKVWTPEELVRVAVKHKPDFAPGKGWNYSNTNFVIAGMIVEKVSGHSLADLVEHRIARPLGLRRTYLVTGVAEDTGPGYAHGYAGDFTRSTPTYRDVSGWPLGGWAGAAGAIVSTPSELATFFSAVLGGRLLPAAQLAQMRTLVPVSKDFAEHGVVGYGLGLLQLRTPCGTVWGHGGDTLGHHSDTMVSADGRRVAVVDVSTQPSSPTPSALKFVEVSGAAATTAACLMLGRAVPAKAAA